MRYILLIMLATLAGVAGFAADNHEVVVRYDGATATVEASEYVSQFITVDVNGADVMVEQDDEVADEITYRLTGQTDNGSFVHKGDFKITLSLEGLQLASQTGAAMQIKNGKRIAIVLKDGTENVLTDKDGGDLYLYSIDNDGIDTNQSMYIMGGNIVTLGNYMHELGIDVNDKSPKKNLYIQGGTIVCVGGTSQISHPAATDGSQPALYYKGKVNAGTSLLLRQASDGADVLRYLLERDYTREAGGTAPDLCLMMTSPQLIVGNDYELIDKKHGNTIGILTDLQAPYSSMEAASVFTGEAFSYESFTLGQTTLSYREADICHDSPEIPILVLYLHGGSARGNDNEAQLREAAVSVIYQYLYSRQIPATFIVPQCPSGGGWTGQLRKVVNELMKRKSNDGAHDANRVYVMGGSMGGTGTWAQLSHFPDFYAAAMPVAGNPTGLDAAAVATTPVLTVMGTADNMMSIPTVEQFQTEVLAAGGTLILETEEGWSHPTTCEQSYTDQRLDWLFSNVRGDEDCVSSPSGIEGSLIVYDLSGRRVNRTGKGIYIIGGRKVVSKSSK